MGEQLLEQVRQRKQNRERLKLSTIRRVGRFRYEVAFDVALGQVTGVLRIEVSFTHGKRERDPHLDEIEDLARALVINNLAPIAKVPM